MKVGSVRTMLIFSWDRRNFFTSLLKANKDTEPSMDDDMMLQLATFFCRANSISYYVKIVCCLFEFLVLWKSVWLFLIQRSLN